MKLSDKKMKIIAAIFFLPGSIAGICTYRYNLAHTDNPVTYGKYGSILLYFTGMFFNAME